MLLKELCEYSGVSGGECAIRRRIVLALEEMGSPYQIDRLGNVVAHNPGKAGALRLLLAARMDEPGLMIYDITEEGFLRFKTIGDVRPRHLAGRTVRIGKKDVMGVVGFAPYHMMRITQEQKMQSASHQHIDIGADTGKDAAERVGIGDFAVVDSGFCVMGNKYKGRAIGGRAGCWALLALLRSKPEWEFDVVFTTMYEVGQRGMEAAAFSLRPQFVVSVDGIQAEDLPGSPGGEERVELGQGVCIPLIDAGFAYPREVCQRWAEKAQVSDIPCRLVQYAPSAAQAGFAALVGGGATALSLLIPCRGMDTPAGILAGEDLQAMERMLALIAGQSV